MMATSETLLTVIAIRLAALVVAGLVGQAATADHPRPEMRCAPAAGDVHPHPVDRPEANDVLRDMLLRD